MGCLYLFAFNLCIRKYSSGTSQALILENQFSVAADFIAPVAFFYSWVRNVDTRAFHSAIVRPVYIIGTRRTGESVVGDEKRRSLSCRFQSLGCVCGSFNPYLPCVGTYPPSFSRSIEGGVCVIH
jgi:hypothetical protein